LANAAVGFAEEHHPEAADGYVEAARCESMRLRGAVLEADVRQALLSSSLFGPQQQGAEDVHAEHLAAIRVAGRRAGC
jgi:hypothetical protein